MSVAIVTGGAGGLGAAIVTRLMTRGDTVYVADYDGAAAESVAERLNAEAAAGSAVAVRIDVSSDEQNRALIDRIGQEHGRLDRLINNAGIQQRAPFGSLGYEEWSRVIDVNLWSVASLSQAAATIWADRPGGAIVNTASRVWLAGGPLAYAASKGGIVALTHALAAELGHLDVRVNAVAPGTVVTPIVAAGQQDDAAYQEHLAHVARLPLISRLGVPDDIASVVDFLASEDAGYVTAEIVNVAGGAHQAPVGFARQGRETA